VITFNSEKDMEDFFFQYSDNYSGWFDLHPSVAWEKRRQVNFGTYGICDLLFIGTETTADSRIIHVRLIELKNTPLNCANIAQVARYKQFFDKIEEESGYVVNFKANLIGLKTLPVAGDFAYLAQNIDWLDVFETHVQPTGITIKIVSEWGPAGFSDSETDRFLSVHVDHLFVAEGA
jgi:hypothetical protein